MLKTSPAVDFSNNDSSKGSLEDSLGSFALACLKKADLLSVAEKILNKQELEKSDALLLTQATPPHLGKLAEIAAAIWKNQTQNNRVRPVVFVPIGYLMENYSFSEACKQLARRIKNIDESISINRSIFIAIDRWLGDFSFSQLLEILAETDRILNDCKNRFRLLGPSGSEIEELVEASSVETSLRSVLRSLKSNNISRIEGGTNIELHREALADGFAISVGQDVSELWDTPLSRTSFIETLFQIKEELMPSGRCDIWFPWARRRKKNVSEQAPLANHFLRCVACARLILPDIKYIRAPVSRMGVRFADVSLLFGANDLGFAAVDEHTVSQLDLLPLSELRYLASVDLRIVQQEFAIINEKGNINQNE